VWQQRLRASVARLQSQISKARATSCGCFGRKVQVGRSSPCCWNVPLH
jgi:hypothetical protein